MSDATVGVIDQSGAGTKKVDVSEMTVNAQTVERQRVAIGDGTTGASLAKVSSSGGLFVQQVGAASFTPGQVALDGTTPVSVAAARTGVPGTGRVSITVVNSSDSDIWLGGASVSSSTGLTLSGGSSVTLQTTAAIYAVLDAAGTPTITFYEIY